MSTNLAIMFSPRETIFVEIQVYVAMVTLKISDTIDILIALRGYRSKPIPKIHEIQRFTKLTDHIHWQ